METPPTQQPHGQGPSPAVTAVAVVQILGCLPFVLFGGLSLADMLRYPQHASQSFALTVTGLPFLFGLIAAATSFGLFRLQSWAREMTLFLATVPVAACVLFLIVFHPARHFDDLFGFIARILLVVLAPVSIWWWVLFTRPSVRAQFH